MILNHILNSLTDFQLDVNLCNFSLIWPDFYVQILPTDRYTYFLSKMFINYLILLTSLDQVIITKCIYFCAQIKCIFSLLVCKLAKRPRLLRLIRFSTSFTQSQWTSLSRESFMMLLSYDAFNVNYTKSVIYVAARN